jgi:hypothetical protein
MGFYLTVDKRLFKVRRGEDELTMYHFAQQDKRRCVYNMKWMDYISQGLSVRKVLHRFGYLLQYHMAMHYTYHYYQSMAMVCVLLLLRFGTANLVVYKLDYTYIGQYRIDMYHIGMKIV